jgi:hypothetical protein
MRAPPAAQRPTEGAEEVVALEHIEYPGTPQLEGQSEATGGHLTGTDEFLPGQKGLRAAHGRPLGYLTGVFVCTIEIGHQLQHKSAGAVEECRVSDDLRAGPRPRPRPGEGIPGPAVTCRLPVSQ